MKIVAYINAGNSSEVLNGCLTHHRNLGVDHFIILHIHSDDDTPDRLRALAREHNDVTVIFTTVEEVIFGTVRQQALALAHRRLSADWVLSIDPDERWFVRGRRLKDSLAAVEAETVTLRRYNVVWPSPELPPDLGERPLALDELALAAHPIPIPPERRDDLGGIPWVLTSIGPKSAIRAKPHLVFDFGGHGAVDLRTQTAVADRFHPDVLIAQLAFTTLERFQRKVQVLGRDWLEIKKRLPKATGWHWDRWGQLYKAGPEAVRTEWARQFMTPEAACALVGHRVVVPGPMAFDREQQS